MLSSLNVQVFSVAGWFNRFGLLKLVIPFSNVVVCCCYSLESAGLEVWTMVMLFWIVWQACYSFIVTNLAWTFCSLVWYILVNRLGVFCVWNCWRFLGILCSLVGLFCLGTAGFCLKLLYSFGLFEAVMQVVGKLFLLCRFWLFVLWVGSQGLAFVILNC